MDYNLTFIVVTFSTLILVIAISILLVYSGKENWKLFAEGIFDHDVTKEEHHTSRSGTMVHTTSRYTVKMSDIYFQSGSIVYGLRNCQGLPVEKGVSIKIYKSNKGKYRIEEVRN